MPEPRPSDAELERALRAIGRDLAFPPTPALAAAATSRLAAERARPAPARRWPRGRRRPLVLVAIGVLALLAIAAAARFVIGVAEIRVQPPGSPTATAPPLGAGGLGAPVALPDAEAAVGFRIGLPPGPAPDAVFVFEGPAGSDGALLAWEPSDRYPPLGGTPWRLLLMQVEGDEEVLLKTTGAAEDVRIVSVDRRRAFWLVEPHVLDVRTADGSRRFSVEGNVLIWAEGAITYRLETPLGLRDALSLAASIR
ncbi:MAG TPA: hypothetical protein VF029_05960 [Actinomycetota bacterium]